MVPLQEIARAASVSIDKVRYWCRLLQVEPTKFNGIRMVDPDTAGKFEYMAALVNAGSTPADAVHQVRAMAVDGKVPPANTSAIVPVAAGNQSSVARVEQLERAVMALVESHRRETEQARADTAAILEAHRLEGIRNQAHVDELRKELASIAANLARQAIANRPAVSPCLLEAPKPVTAWSPPPQRPRLEGVQRWIAHLIDPTKLRRR